MGLINFILKLFGCEPKRSLRSIWYFDLSNHEASIEILYDPNSDDVKYIAKGDIHEVPNTYNRMLMAVSMLNGFIRKDQFNNLSEDEIVAQLRKWCTDAYRSNERKRKKRLKKQRKDVRKKDKKRS